MNTYNSLSIQKIFKNRHQTSVLFLKKKRKKNCYFLLNNQSIRLHTLIRIKI